MKELIKDVGTAVACLMVVIGLYCFANQDRLPVQWPGHPYTDTDKGGGNH